MASATILLLETPLTSAKLSKASRRLSGRHILTFFFIIIIPEISGGLLFKLCLLSMENPDDMLSYRADVYLFVREALLCGRVIIADSIFSDLV